MNEVYRSDNLSVLQSMESQSVDLIYIDPPFNTGKTQKRKIQKMVADSDGDRIGYGGKAYKTVQGTDEKELHYNDAYTDYISEFLQPRIIEAHRILKNTGTFYLHLDYREVHYAKVMCDQIFGRENFLNEIIWAYDYGAKSKSKWPTKHDNILVYVKDINNYFFDSTKIDRIPYMAPGLVGPDKAEIGKLPTDTWWMTIVPTNGKEKTGYPTQKPEKLLERILNASCPENGTVLDFFAGCYDDITEVLTDNGWKLFDDVTNRDKICSLEPINNKIEYVNFVDRQVKEYNGDLIHFKGRSCDLAVTPDHRMFYKEYRNNESKFARADSVFPYTFKLPNTGIYQSYRLDNSDEYLEFLGFWYGDGYKLTRNENNKGFRFGLNVSIPKSDYIISLLDKLGWKYNIYPHDENSIKILITNEVEYNKLEGNKYTKRLPIWCYTLSPKQAWHFIEGFSKADGTSTVEKSDKTKITLWNSNKELMNDLQRLLIHAGYASTLSKRAKKITFLKNGRKIVPKEQPYALYIKRTEGLQLTKRNITKLSYNGKVFCLTLEKNHIMMVRRNGKIAWCGNSGTTAIAAAKLNRRFIMVDNNYDAIDVIKNRINSLFPNIDISYYYNIGDFMNDNTDDEENENEENENEEIE